MDHSRLRIAIFGAVACCLALSADGATYSLVTEPDQGLTPIYNLIGSAKHTLDMTMYEFVDTKAEQLLAQAASSGVTVRVILDQNGEKSSNTAAFTYLSSHGVQVHWANPTYAFTHQKTITVDGATSAIMTLNLTTQYYSTSRDFAVIENNPQDVAAIETTFNADFANSTITPAPATDLVWSPTNAQTAILNVINSAKHTLTVENEEMAYATITNALVSAAARGVLVQVIMTNDANDYASAFNQLVAAGVEVSTYAYTASLYIHAKVILADYGSPGAQVFIGSENFSNGSLNKNRELGLILTDAAIMQSLDGTLTADLKGATPWTGSKPAFSLTANPSVVTVNAGKSATSTVTAAVFDGFNSNVSLAATGLPSGVTAKFTPVAIAAPGSGNSTIQITATAAAKPGNYAITITGRGVGFTASAGLTLTIAAVHVANAASLQPGFASGSWVSIFGENLSPVTDAWSNSIVDGKLPVSLDGVKVTIAGQPGFPAYISPTQINAVAPDIGSGTVPVTIDAPNGITTSFTAIAQAAQPAFFQWGSYAVATHADYSYAVKNGTLSATTVAAAPGEVIVLWGTGFGPTNPVAPQGFVTPSDTTYYTAEPVTVTLGNTPVTVYNAALAPGFAALYQIAIQVPESLPESDYPVVASVSGVQSPGSVLLTVAPGSK